MMLRPYSCFPLGFILVFMNIAAQISGYEGEYLCPERPLTIHPCNCTKSTASGLSIECENTNLASLSVALSNIAEQKFDVWSLVINKSHFHELFGPLFLNLKAKKISIRNTPIESIDEYIFYGVNETLTEIEFINTSLKSFPKSFKILGKLTSLVLDRHNILALNYSAVFDGPINQKLEHLRISNGNITDIPIEFLQSLRKLKTLDLHGNQIRELKKNQFKNLRDLESIDISYNDLPKLDSSHIADLTKLGFCNVSHNAITEIARGTFARNSVLRLLNMSGNKIKRLDANSFRGMRFLRRLFLSDNLISDIGRGTFSSVTRIGTIDLARNQLRKVDYQMFAQLNYIERIDLAENKISEIQKQSFKDLYLTHINISHNLVEKFEPLSFENCVNMTTLDLSYNLINSFPRKTFDELSYATEFLLSFNQLSNFSAVPLGNMTGLKILNVSHNEIVEIPKNTFPKLYELHTIDVSHNKLTYIFNGVFQTLFSIRNLNLSFNHLDEIKPATFGTVPTLLELNLNNNLLQKISKGSLTKLSSLRSITLENNQLTQIFEIPNSLNSLYLRNNSIQVIHPRTWPSMNALIELDLSSNSVENRLTEHSFEGLITLRLLNLNNNGISTIPGSSFSILSTLQYLHLENNNIPDVPTSAFGKLPVVFELNLSNNGISKVGTKAFDGLLQLIKLDLSKNNISVIPSDAFNGLVSLQSLDLSFNKLKKLENKTNGVLDTCLSLEEINLSNNKFGIVSKKTFPSDPYIPYRLRKIDLSYNEIPVLTNDLAFGTQKVKFLNLSHNMINEIRRNVFLNLTELETLDLSHNELTMFTTENSDKNVTFPGNLTNLYANNNQIRLLPVGEFSDPAKVKLINIQNNHIESFDFDIFKDLQSGLQLFIAGNPLRCDCNIRPLTHFYQTVLDVPQSFTDIVCHSPDSLANIPLHGIPDDNLNCINATNHLNIELAPKPDLSFREIFFYKGNLSISWTVPQINKDIAGFHVSIRSQNNQILVEHHVSYEYRTDHIGGTEICQEDCEHLELCVLSKDSHGSINGWFDTQCLFLPNDLKYVREKYAGRNDQIYVVYSKRKPIRTKTTYKYHNLLSSRATSTFQIFRLKELFFQFIFVYLTKKSLQ